MNKVNSIGSNGSLEHSRQSDIFAFLEYTDIRMNTHHGRWQREGPSPLNPAAPTGKEKGDLKLEKG